MNALIRVLNLRAPFSCEYVSDALILTLAKLHRGDEQSTEGRHHVLNLARPIVS